MDLAVAPAMTSNTLSGCETARRRLAFGQRFKDCMTKDGVNYARATHPGSSQDLRCQADRHRRRPTQHIPPSSQGAQPRAPRRQGVDRAQLVGDAGQGERVPLRKCVWKPGRLTICRLTICWRCRDSSHGLFGLIPTADAMASTRGRPYSRLSLINVPRRRTLLSLSSVFCKFRACLSASAPLFPPMPGSIIYGVRASFLIVASVRRFVVP